MIVSIMNVVFMLGYSCMFNVFVLYNQQSLDGVSNVTLIAIGQPSPFFMTIAENRTVQVTVTVPPYSVSRFLFDVDLPYDSLSACMTVQSINVTSTIGTNIPAFSPDTSKGIVFTPTYTSGLNNSQMTYGYLDLGIITNIGRDQLHKY